MASPARKLSPATSEKFRLRNTCSGRIGSAARASIIRKAATVATATNARPRICGDVQAYWLPPQVEMSTIAVVATARTSAPR
jgi:hypothetical protein